MLLAWAGYQICVKRRLFDALVVENSVVLIAKVLMFSYRRDCDKFLPMGQGALACSSGGMPVRGRAAILLGISDTLVGIRRGLVW